MRSPDPPELFRSIVDEVVVRDVYGIRDAGPLLHIFDIGANVGVFSLFARMLHPSASVVAVEAVPELMPYLRENADGFTIDCRNMAMWPDPVAPLEVWPYRFQSRVRRGVPDLPAVQGITLPSIVAGCDPNTTFLKIDVEGGEIELIGHAASEAAIATIRHVAIELHYPAEKPGVFAGWAEARFAGSHAITYADEWHGHRVLRMQRKC